MNPKENRVQYKYRLSNQGVFGSPRVLSLLKSEHKSMLENDTEVHLYYPNSFCPEKAKTSDRISRIESTAYDTGRKQQKERMLLIYFAPVFLFLFRYFISIRKQSFSKVEKCILVFNFRHLALRDLDHHPELLPFMRL